MNYAAMTERLIDAAIYNEQASGAYVAGARKDLNEARAAIEDALSAKDRELAEARAEREELRSAIFGCDFFDPKLSNGCFVEMARTTEAARKGALDRAATAERARDEALSALREKEERVRVLEEALLNARGLIDTPVARRKHAGDEFYNEVVASLRSVLTPVSREQRREEA